MASSDEEGEIVPVSVTNYHLVTDRDLPASFSELPLHLSDHETLIENRESSVMYVHGTTDGGLQPVYRPVIGWRLELSDLVPKLYVLSKGKTWIKLLKPRNSYENVIKSVKIVIRCLHFVKRNVEATRDQISRHVIKTFSSYDVLEPIEEYLSAHLPLIRSAMANDKDLAKSKYLRTFLMETENPGKREHHLENQTKNKAKFIVPDDEEEPEEEEPDEDEHEEEEEEEEEVLFDQVCAYCDNGGDVLPCDGECMRSFHPTIDSGVETSCESLGFANAAQYEAIPTFFCGNCKHKKHQCFACGMLGSSDKSSSTATEVFPCVSATCGHFYHPKCVSKLLYPSDETLAKKLESQIVAGDSFTCPVHKCRVCKKGENKDVHELQFAVCRRCPNAYHRKCLPKTIAFESSADGTIKQRAWDDLLPKRILMYCTKHPILPELLTPKRDHIIFPCIIRKKNQEGRFMIERKSKAFGNLEKNLEKVLEKSESASMPKLVDRRCNNTKPITSVMEKGKSLNMKGNKCSSSIENNAPIFKNQKQPCTSGFVQKDTKREQHFIKKPMKKIVLVDKPPVVDTDMETRILNLIKDTTASFDAEKFIEEKRRRCSGNKNYVQQTGLDKTITIGKVEGSVKAVRAALKKLEEGGSVEDAKAVCEPNVLNQLIKWNKKLRTYLAPFLHGTRYTSFGRHFTKADKLMEIVDRLHWYVKDGDTIVDFCCGSNDFSTFMKEKLDSMGKTNCSYKNYDVITPKNTFCFEKRDWFSVPVDALPDGSRLVMGLNPPFGVQAFLANKFINHALKFKPKLLILIVPKETKRLDEKWLPYDLIWEEEDMLSGKSFYLPGSVSVEDKPLDDWNVNSPPLSLWSHPDWTSKHKQIAEKKCHVRQNQYQNNNKREKKRKKNKKGGVSNYLMEEKHDCYDDFSTIMTKYPDISNILDDVPEASDGTHPGGSKASDTTGTHFGDDVSDMDLDSPPHVSPQFNTTDHTSVPNDQSGIGFQNTFPPNQYHYGYGHPGYPIATSATPPGVGVGPGPSFIYQGESSIWPPGTCPPDYHRFG